MKYFAYGSNMLTRRLTAPGRAPSAFACGVARTLGSVVRFHKVGADGSGKCTLVSNSDEAAAAFGVLYEVADADAESLDRAEGVHVGGYVRRAVRLRLSAERVVDAMTYVAGERYLDPSCVPFDWYRDLVVAGAIEHGLPSRYVEWLAQVPAEADPNAARAARARRLLDGS